MYPNYLNCVDTRYLLKTDDGALISLTTIGRAAIRKEQDDAMERLLQARMGTRRF